MIVWRSELDRKLNDHKQENKKAHSQHDGRFGELMLRIKERDTRLIDLEDRITDLGTKMQYMATILDQLQKDNLRLTKSENKPLTVQIKSSEPADTVPQRVTYTDIEKAEFHKRRQEKREEKKNK
jgi:hypothetical protein